MRPSRRELLQTAAVAAAARPPMLQGAAVDAHWPRLEAADTPKLALEISNSGPVATSPGTKPMGNLAAAGMDEAGMRRVKQLGVNHVLSGGPAIPWREEDIRARMDKLESWRPYAWQPDDRRVFQDDLRQAGSGRGDREGPPIASAQPGGRDCRWWNTTSMRTASSRDITRRPDARARGLTAFDYARVKDLPPLPNEGAHTLDEIWANITYFLKAVIPVAEESGVRMALHPNDPPAPHQPRVGTDHGHGGRAGRN